MKLFKKLTLACMLAPLALISSLVFADLGKFHNKHGIINHKILQQLNLTDEQEDQIKTLHKELKVQMKEHHATLKSKKAELNNELLNLMLSEKFDQTAISAQLEKGTLNCTKHQVKILEQQHKIFAILTPEQKEQYLKLFTTKKRKAKQKLRSIHIP